MQRVLVLLALLLVSGAAAFAVWALREDVLGVRGAGGEDEGRATDGAGTAAGRPREGTGPGAGPGGRPKGRARRPGIVESSGDPLWDQARREAAADRFLEALELVAAARTSGAAAWKDAERLRTIVPWEDAALDAFEAALPAGAHDVLLAWLKRLERAVLDPARRKRLDRLRRKLAESGKLDLATIVAAADEAGRTAIQAHLQRFGGVAPPGPAGGAVGAGAVPNALDENLRTLRRRNEERAGMSRGRPEEAPLPVDDAAVREQRRLEQLEKLRQRSAEGLLEPIAAGLAWIALHQADDGEISDDAATARCVFLGHGPYCTADGGAGKGQYALAATALSVLALLDFRDQDLAGLFEPTLARSVAWLRGRMRKDGSFAQSGYESGIALMALGQAARSSRSADLRRDVERGLKFVAGKVSADGGFRYSWGNPGDLSVTGWYVQAFEAARDAGVAVPGTFRADLLRFVRSMQVDDLRFSYDARKQASPTLAGVGMLSLEILDTKAAEPLHDKWIKALADGATRGRANLYQTYYDVRVELALQGELSPARHAVLVDLPRVMQRKDLPAAGVFAPTPVDAKAAQPVKGRAAWSDFGMMNRGGRVVVTAFGVLTMEHALYRR